MKKLILLSLAAMLLISAPSFAGTDNKTKKANQATQEWRYELESQVTGPQNSEVVKVWSFSKDPKIAQRQASKTRCTGLFLRGLSAIKRNA